MDLLEDLKMLRLNFSFLILLLNFVMIYIIFKMLVLLKNHLSYFKDNIFKSFYKKYTFIFFEKIDFCHNI